MGLVNLYVYKFLFSVCLLMSSVTALAQPKANFTIDKSSGCSPLTVSFTNTTTNASNAATYQWSLGNGSSSSSFSAGAVYFDAKTYTVTLTVKDGNFTDTKTATVTVYKTPTVDFTAVPAKGCAPLEVTFNSNAVPGDGTIANYFWDYGDGTTSQGIDQQAVKHNYTFGQKPPVKLTVTNSFGCFATKEKSNVVEITAGVRVAFTADNTTLCALPDRVNFINTSTGPGTLSYLWDFGNGQTSTDKIPAAVTYTNRGLQTVKLKVTSSEGCADSIVKKDYINAANFNSGFDMPAAACSGSTIGFVNKSSPAPTHSLWKFSDNNSTLIGVNASHTFTQPGTYQVQLINTYGNCFDTATKAISIGEGIVLNGFLNTGTSACRPPYAVTFEDTSSTAVRWLWNFGTGAAADTANTKNASFSFVQNRTYNVSLTVTNAAGCQSTVTKAINTGLSNVSFSYIKSTSVNGLNGCPGMAVQFKSFPEGEVVEHRWDFGNGSTSTDAVPEHTFDTAGKYTVKLFYKTRAGCEDSVVYTNYVNVYVKPKAEFESLSGVTICGNEPVRFKDLSDTATKWVWDFGDGNSSDLQNPVHTYNNAGLFNVSLIATNQFCSDTIKKEQFIKLSPPFPDITSFSRNCDDRGRIFLKQASRGAVEWKWDFGDGSPVITHRDEMPEVSHLYGKSGVYKVTLFTTNGICTTYDTIYVSVVIKQKPVITIDKNIICGSDTITLTANGLDSIRYYDEATKTIRSHPYSGRWEYADGTLHSNVSNTWYPPQITQRLTNIRPGTQQLRLVTYDGINGCYDTSNLVTLQVSGPTVGFTVANAAFCANTPVVFKDASAPTGNVPITSWVWDFGDSTGLTVNNNNDVIHKYNDAQYFYPRLRVTDANGCFAETPQNGTRLEAYGPLANFSASDTVIAPNTPIVFSNTTNTWPGYPVTYTWDFGDSTSLSSATSPTHVYTKAGIYTVKLVARSTFGCIDSMVKVSYIVVASVKSAFDTDASYVSGTSCPPLLAKFESKAAFANRIFWDFGDNSYADNTPNPSHTYYQPGIYKVTMYAYGEGDDVDSSTHEIVVNGPVGTVKPSLLQGCSPTNITLTATARNATRFTWDFGDGYVAESKDTFSVHQYLKPGIFFPKVIMRDANGCTATFISEDSIVIDAVQNAITASPKIICDSAVVQLRSNGSNFIADSLQMPARYHWDFGTGNAGDTAGGINASFKYDKAGRYIIKFTTTSAFGCVSTVADTVVVAAKPKIAINAPDNACLQSPVLIADVGAHAEGDTWQWQLGDGKTSGKKTPDAVTYSTPGQYRITLIKTASIGCTDTATKLINIQPSPVIGLAAKELALCKGDTALLQANDGASYSWFAGAVPVSNTAALKVSPAQTTWYYVKVENRFGCAATDSVKINVSQPFKVAVNTDAFDICAGSKVRLTATGAVTYKWIPAEGLSNTAVANPMAQPLTTTTYKVVGYGADQCFTDTGSVHIKVNPLPRVNAGNDTVVMVGATVPLKALASTDVTSIKWTPSSYLSCTACATPVSTPRAPMTYQVTVSNSFGCTATDTIKVNLQCSSSVVFIPNSFTPNNDGVNDIFYPRGMGIKTVKYFRIFDRWGEVIFERGSFAIDDKRAGWDGTFRGQALPAGVFVYTTEMVCDNGESFTLKGSIMIIR